LQRLDERESEQPVIIGMDDGKTCKAKMQEGSIRPEPARRCTRYPDAPETDLPSCHFINTHQKGAFKIVRLIWDPEVTVLREPVSAIISLISGKNTGKFADSGAGRDDISARCRASSAFFRTIPYAR
jgi:hypothetical protein